MAAIVGFGYWWMATARLRERHTVSPQGQAHLLNTSTQLGAHINGRTKGRKVVTMSEERKVCVEVITKGFTHEEMLNAGKITRRGPPDARCSIKPTELQPEFLVWASSAMADLIPP